MRLRWLILVCFAFVVSGQTFVRKSVCASGCDYASTLTGLQNAVSDAASYQGSSCVPYVIEIDPANPVDLNGNTITLPAKTCAQYIRIRSMQIGSLPADGTRLDPSTQSGYLAHIQSTTSTPGSPMVVGPASAYTRYWAFEGIDFYGNGVAPAADHYYFVLVLLGDTGGTFPSSVDRSLRPDHFEVKHCWLHGVPGARNVANALALGGNNILVADNVIEDVAVDGSEAHAVAINFTDGAIDMVNNTLDAATENTIVGGAFAPAGQLPSFIRFIGNKYSKKGYYKFQTSAADPTWACRQGNVHRNTATNHDWICNVSGTWIDQGRISANGPSVVKNIWEIKMGRGFRVFGNDLSGIWWPSAQNGEVFVLNLTTQNTASNPAWIQPNNIAAQPWTTVTDIYIGENTIHDAMSVVSMSYPANGGTVCQFPTPSNPCYINAHNNIRIYDNLATNMADERDYDKGSPLGGWFAALNEGDFNIDLRHNTYLLSTTTAASGSMPLFMAQTPDPFQTGFINFRDNISPLGMHNVSVSGHSLGGVCDFISGLARTASYDFGGNVLTTDKAAWNGSSYPITVGAIPSPCNTYFTYPTGTQSAANGAAVVDGNSRVKAPYQNTATDGRDSGADVDHVNWATSGAANGAFNAALEYKLRSAVTSRSGGQRGVSVYFTAPSVNDCTWELSSDANAYSSPVPVTSQTRNGRDGIAIWSGLSPGQVYFARGTCDGFKLEQTIDGRRLMFITAP